jgi:hypothetical protein
MTTRKSMAANRPVRWADIHRAAVMLGLVASFNKGDILKLSKKLNDSPHTTRLSRGLYKVSDETWARLTREESIAA